MYIGDTDYPESTDSDWTLRLGYLNDVLDSWAIEGGRNGIKWRELFVDLSDAPDGDTVTDGTGVYDMPTDFVSLSSLVKIGDAYYDYISADRVLSQTNADSSRRYFYITGNASTGFKLHINPSSSTGDTISYSYYKRPTALSDSTDIIEMSNPDYAVYRVLAILHEGDFRDNLVNFYMQRAEEVLGQMIIENEVPPIYNDYNLEDLGYFRHGEAFGL
jgi:hypothetical protein